MVVIHFNEKTDKPLIDQAVNEVFDKSWLSNRESAGRSDWGVDTEKSDSERTAVHLAKHIFQNIEKFKNANITNIYKWLQDNLHKLSMQDRGF